MLRVVRAEDAHLEGIAALWNEMMAFHAARDPWFAPLPDGGDRYAAYAATQREREDALLLVALEDERVVAFLLAYVQERPPVFERRRVGVVSDVVVTAGRRRHGIASMLDERAREWFRDRNVARVELQVAAANEVSQAFWAARGYVPSMLTLTRDLR